jgi:type III restriction enzyme
MQVKWVPGVNNLKTFGRWQFAEFGDVYEMDEKFNKLIESAISEQAKMEAA